MRNNHKNTTDSSKARSIDHGINSSQQQYTCNCDYSKRISLKKLFAGLELVCIVKTETVTEILEMLPEAAGFWQHF